MSPATIKQALVQYEGQCFDLPLDTMPLLIYLVAAGPPTTAN